MKADPCVCFWCTHRVTPATLALWKQPHVPGLPLTKARILELLAKRGAP